MGLRKQRRPFVVAKCAQTLDGKSATRNGRSKWITSQEARDYARRKRDGFDAILVGIETVLKDDPSLAGVKNKRLTKIVVDSSLRISGRAKLFQKTQGVIIATTKNASVKKKKELASLDADVVECPRENNRVRLTYLFDELCRRGVKKLLIEGGPTMVGSALKQGLVDQMHIYIAPKIMGDTCAKDAIVGFTLLDLTKACTLKNVKIKKFKTDILVVGDVHRDR